MKKPEEISGAAGLTRRGALRQSATLGLGLAAGAGLLVSRRAAAGELERLSEHSIRAKALGYRHEAADVDTGRYPMAAAATKNCANCQLFQRETGADRGGCPLFAGNAVSAAGWCTAWVQRAG